jgi:chemotaxis protein histidine kinase CheA
MTSPELLRFFYSEAREYLDAVEELASGESSFEAGAFVGAARALRGSATMARVPRVAEIALQLERIANGVRDGEVAWSANLRRDLLDTIGDLRRFVSRSASWSTEDDREALDRLAALRALLPPGKATPSTPPTAGTTPIFIALQSSAIASDLENFLGGSAPGDVVSNLVNRLRSLRGIAGVADHPPLGEVADAVERTLRELAPDAMLRDADTELLRAAAAVFRRASSELRARGRFESTAAEVDRFARAASAASASPSASVPEGPVVRVEELFYIDEGPHIVRRGMTPPRSAETRFREEVITRAEHLRRLVAEARVAKDPFTRDRVRRDLKTHLDRLDEFARSFGAQQVASVVAEAATHDSFPETLLDVIENVARVLTTPGIGVDDMERRLAVRERLRWTPISTAVTPPGPSAHSVDRAASPSPRSGRALREMINASLTQLSSLEDVPLIEPVHYDDDAIVPVEALLYRGQAALDRARALRDELRRRGSTDPEALHELYDLLDLARAE